MARSTNPSSLAVQRLWVLFVPCILACWLYTDLPDFISPTPGICLTNQMTKLMAWVLVQFGKDRFAETLLADLYDTVVWVLNVYFWISYYQVFVHIWVLYTGVSTQ